MWARPTWPASHRPPRSPPSLPSCASPSGRCRFAADRASGACTSRASTSPSTATTAAPSTCRSQCQILATWPGGMKLARTPYALGFIAPDATLSPPVTGARVTALLDPARYEVTRSVALDSPDGAHATVPTGAFLAGVPGADGRVLFANDHGLHESAPLDPGAARATTRPLTRRDLLTEAFRLLGAPYGWGGQDGGRDCSPLPARRLRLLRYRAAPHERAPDDGGHLRHRRVRHARRTAQAADHRRGRAPGHRAAPLPGAHHALPRARQGRHAHGDPLLRRVRHALRPEGSRRQAPRDAAHGESHHRK